MFLLTGSYYGGLGGFNGYAGDGGYGYGIPYYGHYIKCVYTPVHGLETHGSIDDYDHAIY